MKKYVRLLIYLVLFSLVIYAFIYLGKKDFGSASKLSDSDRFKEDYNMVGDNNFKYVFGSNALDVMKNKTGIIFFSTPNNEYSNYFAKYLNEVLYEYDIKNCYYYNILKDRANYTKYYREIEGLLSNYLYRNDNGVPRLNTPSVVFIYNGNIMHYIDDTSVIRNNVTPNLYWNEENINIFKDKLRYYLSEVNYNE